jgi:lysophospholipase L1-like esterase
MPAHRRLFAAAGGTTALVSGAGLTAWGYAIDSVPAFYGGLAAVAAGALLLVYRASARRPAWAVMTANTLVALVAGLALLEAVWAPLRTPPDAVRAARLSFEDGRWDPERLRQWQELVLRNWFKMLNTLVRFDKSSPYPVVPIPNKRVRFFESEYRINSLGLRGDEVAIDKGDAYRIIAIGESTTFGATVAAADRPWPEVLQSRLRASLECERPLEVINAGMGAWDLSHSLIRLERDLLRLEPDMVLSYHGHNGFKFILRDLPSVAVPHPPVFPKRPSYLLARVEFALELRAFRSWYRYEGDLTERLSTDELMQTEYARLYRRFIGLGRRHGFVPVLGTFSMAVNASSPRDVVEFYALSFPMVRPLIVANALHTSLVEELGRREGVTVVDTRPGLDGAYTQHFIDLVHFTQSGRDLLAEDFLHGIEPLLRRDPTLRCRPRPQ